MESGGVTIGVSCGGEKVPSNGSGGCSKNSGSS